MLVLDAPAPPVRSTELIAHAAEEGIPLDEDQAAELLRRYFDLHEAKCVVSCIACAVRRRHRRRRFLLTEPTNRRGVVSRGTIHARVLDATSDGNGWTLDGLAAHLRVERRHIGRVVDQLATDRKLVTEGSPFDPVVRRAEGAAV